MQLVPGFEKEMILNSTKHNTLSITPGLYGSFSSLNFMKAPLIEDSILSEILK